jgi:hypothetical protein
MESSSFAALGLFLFHIAKSEEINGPLGEIAESPLFIGTYMNSLLQNQPALSVYNDPSEGPRYPAKIKITSTK